MTGPAHTKPTKKLTRKTPLKTAAKKSAAKKTAAKKSAAKKPAALKTAAKKPAAKKTATTSARGVITPEAMAFIGELATQQRREWFEPRKAELTRLLQQPVLAVLHDVGAALLDVFAAVEDAKPKVFRIYRDVRFSKDKSPYKDHVGGTLAVGLSVVYLHVGGDDIFAAVGVYDPSAGQLQAFRAAVDATDIGPRLLKETEGLQQRGYELLSSDALVRAPAGFTPSHPCIRLLRLKGWALKLPPIPVAARANGSLGAVIARGVIDAERAIALAERAFSHRPS